MNRLSRHWLAIVVLAGSLAGCGRYYWSRPPATAEQFDADSGACALEATPGSAPGEYVVFRGETYRRCLSARGWVRAKQGDPPPPGWFRGHE